ncbi:MAG: group II intron reverse transcriptase/maturase [Burkholderiaceae bacterium]
MKRAYIDKADGSKRPLGVPALEDKIVQRASAEVLGAIYEQDFIGFSYGFRPGRSAHDALDAVAVGVTARKVNWILDADISKFFDTIEHDWLIKFIEHRVADARVIRLLKKWLHAGVLEDRQVTRSELGTVQGGSISPLLANIYLHYAFDLWVEQWRRRRAKGQMIIVRYADDWVAGFEHRWDAERFKRDVAQRLKNFGLALHENKTRLIEFGRFARENRSRRGQGKPETFDFLGFTHCCGKTSKGKFMVLRLTSAKRLRAKLHAVKDELRRRMHRPIAEQGQYLRAVVSGHSRYFAVPCNGARVQVFRFQVARLWHRTLCRRSQAKHLSWKRMHRIVEHWLPRPRICHPYLEGHDCACAAAANTASARLARRARGRFIGVSWVSGPRRLRPIPCPPGRGSRGCRRRPARAPSGPTESPRPRAAAPATRAHGGDRPRRRRRSRRRSSASGRAAARIRCRAG